MVENTPRQGRGCFFYGAITMALVIVGVLAGLFFGTRKAIRVAIDTYTASAPAPIPTLQIPPAQRDEMARDLAREAKAASSGRAREMVLDEQELNVLLSTASDLRQYTNQIYLRPEEDRLKAFLSVPLNQFEHWRDLTKKIGGPPITNRYFNGTALLNIGVTNGVLHAGFADLIVNEKTLPTNFTSRIQGQNFAAEASKNPELQAALERVESITVKDGKVHVQFRP